jgi:hypothetical protein
MKIGIVESPKQKTQNAERKTAVERVEWQHWNEMIATCTLTPQNRIFEMKAW